MTRDKWDFKETKQIYKTVYIDGYPYKILRSRRVHKQELVAQKLHKLRKLNDQIIKNMDKRKLKSPNIDIYKYIHKEKNGKSNYLLSEMKLNTGFEGMNKPRSIVFTNKPHVGPDGKRRAEWRDVFLKLDTRTPDITQHELELFIHELAHTGANHIRWRDDDHGEDFTSFENLLKSLL